MNRHAALWRATESRLQRHTGPFSRIRGLARAAALSAPLVLGACAPVRTTPAPPPQARSVLAEQQVMAVLWTKTAAEARALRYQAYNAARVALDQALESRPSQLPAAVVADIDETVIDTAQFQADLLAHDLRFPDGWQAWLAAAEGQAIAGAVEFLQYATNRGVNVFYVTNRRATAAQGTLRNLEALGFPSARADRVLFKTSESSKESRRRVIAQTYEILLLIGDNLDDFADLFGDASVRDRAAAVDAQRAEFGRRFILLPNPMYGSWEGALYGTNRNLSEANLLERRMNALTQPASPPPAPAPLP